MKDKLNKSKSNRILREVGEIVLAFLVAWLGYQGLSIATGTALPIVAVVSDSMYHAGPDFNEWWGIRGQFYDDRGIDRARFTGFPFRNGMSKGDLLLVTGGPSDVGDVIIYERPEQGISIVHRLISVSSEEYVTKGDNNFVADAPVARENYAGKVVFAIPVLGFPRVLLFAFGI